MTLCQFVSYCSTYHSIDHAFAGPQEGWTMNKHPPRVISKPSQGPVFDLPPFQAAISFSGVPAPSLNQHPFKDVFDVYDESGGENDQGNTLGSNGLKNEDRNGEDTDLTSTRSCEPLADSIPWLFPSFVDHECTAFIDNEGGGGGLPSWIQARSGRVTAMSTTWTDSRKLDPSSRGDHRSGGEAEMVVATGFEDGTIWLFSGMCSSRKEGEDTNTISRDSEPSSPRTPTTECPTPNISSGQLGKASLDLSERSPSSQSLKSPNLSPSTSPRNPSSRFLPFAGSPRPSPSQRNSSSTSLTASRRASGSESNGTSLIQQWGGETRSVHHTRKASATVSVSTVISQVSSKPCVSPNPSLQFSAGADVLTSSIDKSKAISIDTDPPSPSQVDLWKMGSQSERSSTFVSERKSAGQVSPRKALENRESGQDSGKLPMTLERLEPFVHVFSEGCGRVVQLMYTKQLCDGMAEEVLLSLKKDGFFAIHSLLDGRVLKSVNIQAHLSSGKSYPVLDCEGFNLLELVDDNYVVIQCRTRSDIILVNLGSCHVKCIPMSYDTRASIVLQKHQDPPILVTAMCKDADSIPEIMTTTFTQPESPDTDDDCWPVMSAPKSLGTIAGLSGDVRGLRRCEDDLILFTRESFVILSVRDHHVDELASVNLGGIGDVKIGPNRSILVQTREQLFIYRLLTGNIELLVSEEMKGLEFVLGVPSAGPFNPEKSAICLLVRSVPIHGRSLECVRVESGQVVPQTPKLTPHILYQTNQEPYQSSKAAVTCTIELDSEWLLLGFSSGDVQKLSYDSSISPASILGKLNGAITVMKVVNVQEIQIVLAGAADGTAAAWEAQSGQLIAKWSLFASPVSHIVRVTAEDNSRLLDSVAFVSSNSPVALVSLSPPQLLFTLPGTRSAVNVIASLGEEILIIYAHGLSRVCDVKSQELRRSMEADTALQVLKDNRWKTWFSHDDIEMEQISHNALNDPILCLDIRSEVEMAIQSLPWLETIRSKQNTTDKCDLMAGTAKSKAHLTRIRFLLSRIGTLGLDSDADTLLKDHLSISMPLVQHKVSVESGKSVSLAEPSSPSHAWKISPRHTAQRLLAIVVLLRVFLNFPDTEKAASQAIIFYSSALPGVVGADFIFPSLEAFSEFWFDSSSDLQQAARLLFGSYLSFYSDAMISRMAETWQQNLLPHRSRNHKHDIGTSQAVLFLGLITIDKYKLLSVALLKDLSESILSFLEQDDDAYRHAIGAELCSNGFQVWQNYVDAISLVRCIFGLATGRNPKTPNEVRQIARHATLHIASVNTPLFMTTLLFDMLNSKAIAHRNATLKLLGFMIRKKPVVLHTSLPRLAEAVVKALDPTVTALRENVQQAATVILGELVKTYPSIDFHGRSQRLAVGTYEGATIVYDLKTATRLYVLEGHKRPISALSWSPDGRRLVSVSLDECKAVVWKVGVGILSMFTPGAPPRQGSGGTATPFKTLNFNVGDEAMMTTAATLEWVLFDWPAERTVCLRIRSTSLSFPV